MKTYAQLVTCACGWTMRMTSPHAACVHRLFGEEAA